VVWCVVLCNGVPYVGVGVFLAADVQSTSKSGYRASLWNPLPDFILLFFFPFDNYFILLSRRLL
jgi:hypothetical protein